MMENVWEYMLQGNFCVCSGFSYAVSVFLQYFFITNQICIELFDNCIAEDNNNLGKTSKNLGKTSKNVDNNLIKIYLVIFNKNVDKNFGKICNKKFHIFKFHIF